MKPASKNCILCHQPGEETIWNDLRILICPRCGLAWQSAFDQPVNYYIDLNADKENPSERKSISRINNAKDRLATIKKFLPSKGICDIGCGDGSFLSILQLAGFQESWGLEPSIYNCTLALKNGLTVVRGDINELPERQEGRRIEAITLFHVIEHLSDPLETMLICKKTLKTGGILVIETPDVEAAIQKVTNHNNTLVYDEHLFYWSQKSLRILLKQMGFEVLSVTHRSFDWKNSPIKTSLARLGLIRYDNKKQALVPAMTDSKEVKNIKVNFLRKFVRTGLAYLVHLLGRDDYLLVVAKRL